MPMGGASRYSLRRHRARPMERVVGEFGADNRASSQDERKGCACSMLPDCGMTLSRVGMDTEQARH